MAASPTDEVEPRQPAKANAGEPAFSQAELFIKIKKSHGFGTKQVTVNDKATDAARQIIPAMCQVLLRDKDLVNKKKQYIEGGCRGNWPELLPLAGKEAQKEGQEQQEQQGSSSSEASS